MHLWPNWIGCLTTDQKIGGSNPPGCVSELYSRTFEVSGLQGFLF